MGLRFVVPVLVLACVPVPVPSAVAAVVTFVVSMVVMFVFFRNVPGRCMGRNRSRASVVVFVAVLGSACASGEGYMVGGGRKGGTDSRRPGGGRRRRLR